MRRRRPPGRSTRARRRGAACWCSSLGPQGLQLDYLESAGGAGQGERDGAGLPGAGPLDLPVGGRGDRVGVIGLVTGVDQVGVPAGGGVRVALAGVDLVQGRPGSAGWHRPGRRPGSSGRPLHGPTPRGSLRVGLRRPRSRSACPTRRRVGRRRRRGVSTCRSRRRCRPPTRPNPSSVVGRPGSPSTAVRRSRSPRPRCSRPPGVHSQVTFAPPVSCPSPGTTTRARPPGGRSLPDVGVPRPARLGAMRRLARRRWNRRSTDLVELNHHLRQDN